MKASFDPYMFYLAKMHPQSKQLINDLLPQEYQLKYQQMFQNNPEILNSYKQRYQTDKQNPLNELDPYSRIILNAVLYKRNLLQISNQMQIFFSFQQQNFNQNNYFMVYLCRKLLHKVKPQSSIQQTYQIIAQMLKITISNVKDIIQFFNEILQNKCQIKFQFLFNYRQQLKLILPQFIKYILEMIASNKKYAHFSKEFFNYCPKSVLQPFSTQLWLKFLRIQCFQESIQKYLNSIWQIIFKKFNEQLQEKLQKLMEYPQFYLNTTLQRNQEFFLRKIYHNIKQNKTQSQKKNYIYENNDWRYNFLGQAIIGQKTSNQIKKQNQQSQWNVVFQKLQTKKINPAAKLPISNKKGIISQHYEQNTNIKKQQITLQKLRAKWNHNNNKKKQVKRQSQCLKFKRHAQRIQKETFKRFLMNDQHAQGIESQKDTNKEKIIESCKQLKNRSHINIYTNQDNKINGSIIEKMPQLVQNIIKQEIFNTKKSQKQLVFCQAVSQSQKNTNLLQKQGKQYTHQQYFLLYLMKQTGNIYPQILLKRFKTNKLNFFWQIKAALKSKQYTKMMIQQFPLILNKLLKKLTQNLRQNPSSDEDISFLVAQIAVKQEIICIIFEDENKNQHQQKSNPLNRFKNKKIHKKSRLVFNKSVQSSFIIQRTEQSKQPASQLAQMQFQPLNFVQQTQNKNNIEQKVETRDKFQAIQEQINANEPYQMIKELTSKQIAQKNIQIFFTMQKYKECHNNSNQNDRNMIEYYQTNSFQIDQIGNQYLQLININQELLDSNKRMPINYIIALLDLDIKSRTNCEKIN